MDGVDEFLKLLPLRLEQETGLFVSSGDVDVGHCLGSDLTRKASGFG